MRATLLSIATAVALISLPVFAQREALPVSKIFTQQQEIRAGVQSATGRYKDMPTSTRSELLRKQELLLSMLEGKRTTDELNEEQQVAAFNTLEWIEAAINNAENERVVCERRQILGSNRKERVCRTAAQLRAERESAQESLLRNACVDCKSN